MTAYNPNMQVILSSDIEKCHIANYPTLGLLNASYRDQAATMWLIPQLNDINEYCGCKDKFTEHQFIALASLISTEYYYLKVSELMLFFFRLKGGHYGKFYGALDPMVITSALLEFIDERRQFYARYDEKQREIRAAQDRKNCMTYAEWCKLKGVEPKNYDIGIKSVNDALGIKKKKYTLEQIAKQAKDIVENTNKLDEVNLSAMRNMFEKNHGKTPEEFLNENPNV